MNRRVFATTAFTLNLLVSGCATVSYQTLEKQAALANGNADKDNPCRTSRQGHTICTLRLKAGESAEVADAEINLRRSADLQKMVLERSGTPPTFFNIVCPADHGARLWSERWAKKVSIKTIRCLKEPL